MSNFVVSLIRTYAPILAGAIVTLVAKYLGVQIDSVQLAVLITSALSALYYLGVRLLERKFPGLGVLLGVKAVPQYVPTPAPAAPAPPVTPPAPAA